MRQDDQVAVAYVTCQCCVPVKVILRPCTAIPSCLILLKRLIRIQSPSRRLPPHLLMTAHGETYSSGAVGELRKKITSIQLLYWVRSQREGQALQWAAYQWGLAFTIVCVLENVSCLHTIRFHRVKSHALWIPVISECCRCLRPLRLCRTSSSSASGPGIPHAQLND